MNKKQTIRLNEEQLKRVVAEAVKRVINEGKCGPSLFEESVAVLEKEELVDILCKWSDTPEFKSTPMLCKMIMDKADDRLNYVIKGRDGKPYDKHGNPLSHYPTGDNDSYVRSQEMRGPITY